MMNQNAPKSDLDALLANVAIVLVDPQFPENVGAAARAAMNFGISRLLVVKNEPLDRSRMLTLATHNAAAIIDSMEIHSSLAAALSPFAFAVGATARQGRHRRLHCDSREMVDYLLPLLACNQVALVFGPEHSGLSNEDLTLCNFMTSIPTAGFSSLNLAQAVAVLCYELYYGLLNASDRAKKRVPKLAESHELEAMYQQVEQMLVTVGFLKTVDHEYWMRNIRQFLGRTGLRAKEVRIVRAFCRQFEWYEKKGQQ
jgi:tRNA/rRNA methyltransferase